MSARDRARRKAMTAHEYHLFEVYENNGTLTKNQAILLSNQHKLERTLKVSKEYLEKLPALMSESALGSQTQSDLEEAKASFDLIHEFLEKLPGEKMGRLSQSQRELLLKSFFSAQNLVTRHQATP